MKRLAIAGLSWPLPAEMTDSALETALLATACTAVIAEPHRNVALCRLACARLSRRIEAQWAFESILVRLKIGRRRKPQFERQRTQVAIGNPSEKKKVTS